MGKVLKEWNPSKTLVCWILKKETSIKQKLKAWKKLRGTVNVEILTQYIFSRISPMVSDARKYDVSENINHYRLNGISY